jgi:hypothetical protein
MMNVLKRIAMGIGGVVVVTLLLALAAPKAVHAIVSTLVTVVNTSSNPVVVQNVKQAEGNYISLLYSNGSYGRILPDGTSTPYAIPSGQDMVITDISWTTICENLFTITCNRSAGDAVLVQLGSGGDFAPGVYNGQATYQNSSLFLVASGAESLKSGYIVSILPVPNIFGGPTGIGESILGLTLHGYLIPASSFAE